MRFKNRFLVLQLVWKDAKANEALNEAVLLQLIRDSILLNFGDFRLGSALSSVQVKYLSHLTGLLVIRCGRSELEEVLCAVTLMTEIKQQRVIIRSLHIAGTVKCCREFALQYHQAVVSQGKLLPQHQLAVAAAEERLQALEL